MLDIPDKLLNEDDFDDTFQPISKDELDKRIGKFIVEIGSYIISKQGPLNRHVVGWWRVTAHNKKEAFEKSLEYVKLELNKNVFYEDDKNGSEDNFYVTFSSRLSGSFVIARTKGDGFTYYFNVDPISDE